MSRAPMVLDRTGGMSPTKPSIYTVAQRAGVSIATVSRVLRGTVAVRDETRQRVLAAADELGWQPSSLARSLAGEATGAVGLVVPDLLGHYAAQVVEGFEERALAEDGSVYVLATHGRPRAPEFVRDLAARTDGLVVMDRTVDDDQVRRLDEHGTRIVLFARPPVGHVPAVRTGNRPVAEELTRHVIEHGHERLAFLGDPVAAPDVAERWAGFQDAHAAAGLPAPSGPVVTGFGEGDGYTAATDLLAQDARPRALICANDLVAFGVYARARELGLGLPGDLAVTGWDDLSAGGLLTPALTSVQQPTRELGERAADLLYQRIAGRRPTSEVLPSTLAIRGSCGCPT